MGLKTYSDFKYDIKDNEVVIYKYVGDQEEVTIPNSINGLPVVDINASLVRDTGFTNSDKLKKVIIPEGVREIGMFSFGYGCKSLETVVIPASVTEMESSAFGSRSLKAIEVNENNPKFASIDGVLFNKDKTELIYFPWGKSYRTGGDLPEGKMEAFDYIIPDGTVTIGYQAFGDCYLIGVTIPDSVKEIKGRAFSNCRCLKDIILPKSITAIDWSTFENCDSLESIGIPENVTKIDNGAFEGCSALEDITIPSNVTEIRFSAFQGCASLTSIAIPKGVKEIEQRTFKDCTSLECINIPSTVEKIDISAFDGCKALERISVDENNPVYNSIDGSLYRKEGNKRIYTPRALLLKNTSEITSLDELAGMTDEELLSKISEESGFEYELEPDDDWKCARSRSEWNIGNIYGEYMKIYAFTTDNRITKLSFSGLDIDRLPLAIAGLSELTVLDISYTKVAELPEWLSRLSKLEILNIYASSVTALPNFIGDLTEMRELHLGASVLTELPDTIGNLTRLEILHLNHTRVSKLPESIGNLKALRSMNLHGSKITELPESIGNITTLEYLYSYYIPLKKLPDSIGNLSSLKRFWICQTKVSELPDSISNLTTLLDFNCRPGRIKELPDELYRILEANKDKVDEEEDEDEDERVKSVIKLNIVIDDGKWNDDE